MPLACGELVLHYFSHGGGFLGSVLLALNEVESGGDEKVSICNNLAIFHELMVVRKPVHH